MHSPRCRYGRLKCRGNPVPAVVSSRCTRILQREVRTYFGFCETPLLLISLTRWVRLRLLAGMWRQWKTPRRRRAALLALGVRPRLTSNTAGSGRGPWYLARAKALSAGLSNAYSKSLGLPTLIDGF